MGLYMIWVASHTILMALVWFLFFLLFCCRFWPFLVIFWYFCSQNMNVRIQEINFASTRNAGSPFLGPQLQFSFFPKIPETMYPKVGVHQRQSGINKGVIRLRRDDISSLGALSGIQAKFTTWCVISRLGARSRGFRPDPGLAARFQNSFCVISRTRCEPQTAG